MWPPVFGRSARERGITFKAAVNAVLRRGLSDGEASARPFRVDARPLNLRPGIELEQALAPPPSWKTTRRSASSELRK